MSLFALYVAIITFKYKICSRFCMQKLDKKNKQITLEDAGAFLPSISVYLNQASRINLASTNKFFRQIVLSNTCWPTIQIFQRACREQHWDSFFLWVLKYIKVIMPEGLIVSVFNNQYEQQLMNLFMSGTIESVQKLDLYFNSEDIHLSTSLCFPNLTEITLRSQCASNQLVKFMLQSLPKITSLSVIKNDMSYTCEKLSTYLKNPLQKLELKPYLLDFQEIRKVTAISSSTLRELEIDVEECENQMIVEIISPLKNLEKLRLFHLENLQTDDELVQILQNTDNLSELTATKAYHFKLTRVINCFKSSSLLSLDITDSKYFNNDDLVTLSKNSPHLKSLNISWCNSLTSEGIIILIDNCLKLETLILTGVKQSKDIIFTQYLPLLKQFNENRFLEMKHKIKSLKNALGQALPVSLYLKELTKIQDQYDAQQFIFNRKLNSERENIKSLRNLKILDCRSCNGISDQILECIYLVNRKLRASNYYGNTMSLFSDDYEDDF